MQARYYDPVIGQFLSTDPVQFEAGRPQYIGRYVYAHNDPINNLDPFGLECYTIQVGGRMGTACDSEEETVGAIRDNLPDDANAIEYGGFIFNETIETEDADTGEVTRRQLYTYTQMSDGRQQTVNIGPPPEGAVSAWHNHPDLGPGSENFSDTRAYSLEGPSRLYDPESGDIAYSHTYNIPFWLITPGGDIKRASPDQMEFRHTPQDSNGRGGLYGEFSIYYSGEQ